MAYPRRGLMAEYAQAVSRGVRFSPGLSHPAAARGQIVPNDQYVTHDDLLRSGGDADRVSRQHVNFNSVEDFSLRCASLHLPGADGAPASVFAIDGLGI